MANGLIEDFPEQPRNRGLANANEISPTTSRHVSVRFAEMSTLVQTERATQDELKSRWHSKDDYAIMKLKFRADVQEMIMKLSTTPMDLVGDEDLYKCIGLERFLSRDILEQTQERKLRHVFCICIAQTRQRMLSIHNEEDLAALSEESSEWTVSRARNLAQLYWDTLNK
eukprot:CAMPEP_0183730968 /NCGR_PEP_ID=MMETSP0737-20130205/33984_1 /TAXON_ID=385413 /ORGANISM="Thalassiosira miniscula, Strain CCMP1093" /LENGTH=169 /DNA_ID=CAMNT_0025963575 /DNA_START=80 /DNA_END=589 /DNA_ORIENTATION=+